MFGKLFNFLCKTFTNSCQLCDTKTSVEAGGGSHFCLDDCLDDNRLGIDDRLDDKLLGCCTTHAPFQYFWFHLYPGH